MKKSKQPCNCRTNVLAVTFTTTQSVWQFSVSIIIQISLGVRALVQVVSGVINKTPHTLFMPDTDSVQCGAVLTICSLSLQQGLWIIRIDVTGLEHSGHSTTQLKSFVNDGSWLILGAADAP